jgi:membrane-associated phospholipid phosphatase
MVKIIKSVTKSIGRGIRYDPEVKKITSRYPRLFHFIKKRLTPNSKYGLYLTLGTIITLAFIYFFFAIVRDYVGQEKLTQVDLRVINIASQFRIPSVDKLMLFITHLAKGENIAVGVVVVSIIFILKRKWHYFSTLLVSVLGSQVFVWIIKNIIERPRPPLSNALVYNSSYSFPSGHTFAAISFYGLIVFFILQSERNKILKRISFFLGLVLVVWIGLSRIYLGAHWPSDVLASFVAGIAWLTIVITSTKIKLKFNHFPKKSKLKAKTILITSLFLILLWFLFIINFFKNNPLQNYNQAPFPTERTIIEKSEIPEKLFAELPVNSESIDGTVMEPINIIVVANQETLTNSFINSNWYTLDRLSFKSIWKLARALIFKRSYPSTPGLPVFWSTYPNTINFGEPTENNSPHERHHIHFWPTPFKTTDNQDIWVGTAHFDQEIKGKFSPIHRTDPAVDKERDRIKNNLIENNKVTSFEEFQITEPTFGVKQTGNQFFTDGKAYILFLNND